MDVANKHAVQCIVMGTRSLDAVHRFVNTSISDYVVHHARCPVIIVPKASH